MAVCSKLEAILRTYSVTEHECGRYPTGDVPSHRDPPLVVLIHHQSSFGKSCPVYFGIQGAAPATRDSSTDRHRVSSNIHPAMNMILTTSLRSHQRGSFVSSGGMCVRPSTEPRTSTIQRGHETCAISPLSNSLKTTKNFVELSNESCCHLLADKKCVPQTQRAFGVFQPEA